ncbi:MAG: serine protease [Bacteroidaceae bacterium]|nr:serine protease [Bacteroidaceae bacterium]
MGELINEFNNLDTLQQIFWGCSIVSSLIFVIQLVLTLIGMDHSDVAVDFDGSDTMDLGNGINLFSIKNLVNFFLGFGWSGVCLYKTITSPILLVLVALLFGCAFVAMFVFIYKQTRKLEKNGAFSINDCLGKSASVYIRIPAGCEGKGKIQISIDGSVHEIDALTDEDEISSGKTVKVVEIVDNETVKVVNTQYNLVI